MSRFTKVKTKKMTVEKKCKKTQMGISANGLHVPVLSESPFSWMTLTRRFSWPNSCTQDVIKRLQYRLEDCNEMKEIRFTKFAIKLALLHQIYVDECLSTEGSAINFFKELRKDSDVVNFNAEKDLFSEMEDAVKHVMAGCKLYLKYVSSVKNHTTDPGSMSQVPPELREPNPFPILEMGLKSQAALYGLKCCFYLEFGYDGAVDALLNIDKAVALEPMRPHWHYLRGCSLSFIRRSEAPEYGKPTNDEIKSYEYAAKNVEHPEYFLGHAEVLRDTAETFVREFHGTREWNKNCQHRVDRLYSESNIAYVRCLQALDRPARLKYRVADGLINLPPPHQNIKKAVEILNESLDNFPNSSTGHHIAAKYIIAFENDPVKARECLLKSLTLDAMNFDVHMELLKLEYRTHRTQVVSIIQRFQMLLYMFHDAPRRMTIYTQLCSYFLFVRNQIPAAITHIYEILILNPDCEQVTKHKPIYFTVPKAVSLYDVLVSEIYCILKKRPVSDLEKCLYDELIERVQNANVNLTVDQRNPKSIRDSIINYTRKCYSIMSPPRCLIQCVYNSIRISAKEANPERFTEKPISSPNRSQGTECKQIRVVYVEESNNENLNNEIYSNGASLFDHQGSSDQKKFPQNGAEKCSNNCIHSSGFEIQLNGLDSFGNLTVERMVELTLPVICPEENSDEDSHPKINGVINHLLANNIGDMNDATHFLKFDNKPHVCMKSAKKSKI